MQLFTYFRSSAAYRVRIALNIKGMAYDSVPVNLLAGDHKQPAYRAKNPQGRVPAFLDDEGNFFTQSTAILEYLEEKHPTPSLLPGDSAARARIRQFAAIIACDIHPLNNLSVLKYLKDNFAAGEPAVAAWYAHWIQAGFAAAEALLETTKTDRDGPYAFGFQPTFADACLVPQMYNARRYDVDLAAFPRLVAVDAFCRQQPAFIAAAPDSQADAP